MNPFAQALSAALELCVASKEITENGGGAGFFYREAPVFDNDSGWRFFSGDESDEYAADPDNFAVCPLADILAACPEIRPLPAEREGAWEWDGEAYVPAEGWQPQN
jgi:hypothetical protein